MGDDKLFKTLKNFEDIQNIRSNKRCLSFFEHVANIVEEIFCWLLLVDEPSKQ